MPIIGWFVGLGYRKKLIENLWVGPVTWPDWNRPTSFLIEGLRSAGVIFGFYAPLYIIYFGLLAHGVAPPPWIWLGLFFGLFTMFLPLWFPVALSWGFISSLQNEQADLRLVALMAGFWLVTFLIPAGFLQVSRSGRYLHAFDPRRILREVKGLGGVYIEAWIYSSIVSLVGHLVIPKKPWGIFWSYQAILYSFNEALLFSPMPPTATAGSLLGGAPRSEKVQVAEQLRSALHCPEGESV